MNLQTLDDLLLDQLRDLYSAEGQILKALPRMIRKAGTQSLSEALEAYRQEMRGQVERLRKIARLLGIRLVGKRCKAVEGLLREGKEVMKLKSDPDIVDAALIAAAQRVVYYEISAYGTARALAEQLGHQEVVDMLQQTLNEESAADAKFTRIAEREVYPNIKALTAGVAVARAAGEETVTVVS